MKVIICGAGQVGWQIARHLSRERNDVTLIDIDEALVRRASEALDVRGVTGFASHPDVLDSAGARDCDLIIAATRSDEVNMVTCQVAQSIFQIPRKIARLRTPAYLDAIYSDLYRTDRLPIDVVISPEREVARVALQRLDAPSTFEADSFLDERAVLYGLRLDTDCPVLSTPLRQLSELFPTLRAVVVGIRRAGRLVAPEPRDQLLPGDMVWIMADAEDAARTLEVFGRDMRRAERVILLGGGRVGQLVAQAIEARAAGRDTGLARITVDRGRRGRVRPGRVVVIERDRDRAEAVADLLSNSVVLNGDALSEEILAEAGVKDADAVLAVTDDDKINLLASVRAHQLGARLTVALVNDPSLAHLVAALPVDVHIDPRATTVSTILRHVRHGRVRDVRLIGEGEAELIEAQVLPSSGLAGRSLRDLSLPRGALLGLVQKGSRVMKPSPDLRLEAGDLVCIFALRADVPEVERLLQVAIDYF